MPRILFFCQNFLGLGHLVRTTEILRCLEGRAETCLLFGGQRVPDFELPASVSHVALPALLRERGELHVVDGDAELQVVMEQRRKLLLEAVDAFAPLALVIEGFPFSKRALAFELVPLLDHMRSRSHSTPVFCSLRDIIMAKAERKPSKERDTIKWLNRYFSGVLIHSDPRVLRLEERFSRVGDIACPVHYTGFVVQSPPPGEPPPGELPDGRPSILVSVGGGRLGNALLRAIADVAGPLAEVRPHDLHVFTGPFAPDDLVAHLEAAAARHRNLIVKRFTPHLISTMQRVDLSISLFGYNTAMNVLRTGVRCLTLPSDKDTEQPLRAERFAEHGLVDVLRPEELSPAPLLERIVSALDRPRRAEPPGFDLGGAERTAALLARVAERAARHDAPPRTATGAELEERIHDHR